MNTGVADSLPSAARCKTRGEGQAHGMPRGRVECAKRCINFIASRGGG